MIRQKKNKVAAVPIMIQGTMSNAGKSVLTAALCRIFRQDGYKVVPFKSQNMALNSGVTPDGLEIGRAQIMQAEAAGVLSDVRFNPVLLKPTAESESQVIVNGKVLCNMNAKDYFSFRSRLIPYILESYESLAEENDIIVIEGAGSPAEINLKKNDIANMGIAELVDAPVLLAGDIDRGGVFASLYGTAALLTRRERKRIKGFLINKFRGDIRLLEDGLLQIQRITHIPVLGVVPYIKNLQIDEEDSLSEFTGNVSAVKRKSDSDASSAESRIHINVVRLPYISNFTDLNSFSRLPFADVTFFDSETEFSRTESLFGKTDLLVIPGTKNTVCAMNMLNDSGLGAFIKSLSVPVIGICGGFQLLGGKLDDSNAFEDGKIPSCLDGLGLLDLETVFTGKKTRKNIDSCLPEIEGYFSFLSGLKVHGYEIHSGVCNCGDFPLSAKGNVLGTYIHGFFDSSDIINAIVRNLFMSKNLPVPEFESYESLREKEYDRLADIVRESLDMSSVYKILAKRGLSLKGRWR